MRDTLCLTSYTHAVLQEELETECLWLACDQKIAIATRQEIPISKAPSIVTVITAEEIKNLGYRTFVEILRTVPGFDILKMGDLGHTIPVVCGVRSENRVRVLINGHFVVNPARGGTIDEIDFPVDNIKRIEIIRVPGSAVYGENAFSTSASLAPGSVYDGRQEYNMELKVKYDDFYFNGWYTNSRSDSFIGPQYALTDVSYIERDYVFGEIGYKKTFEESFTIRPRLYYDQGDYDNYIKSLPDDTTLPFDTDGDGVIDILTTYPDGIIYRLKPIERMVGTEIPFDYKVFDGNVITLGMEYRLINQSSGHSLYNFDPQTLDSLDSVQDFSDSHPFFEDHTRRVLSFYLQDTWDITDTLNLTLGVRHDRYNDFGNATSPHVFCGIELPVLMHAINTY